MKLPIHIVHSIAVSALLGTLACHTASAAAIANRYVQSNLVSDQAGVAAHTDSNTVNSWGLTVGRGILWVANNGSGTLIPYSPTGVPRRPVVAVPAGGGTNGGTPTGLEFNTTRAFVITNGQNVGPSAFIAATEDGTIAAWNGASGDTAVLVVDRSGENAVYKGLAIVPGTNRAPMLVASDFHNARLDMFDGHFGFVGSFTDTNVPAGFAPFNVRNLGGRLFVTFAKQALPEAGDDEPGPGNGFVDIFNADGTVALRLISGGALNSPWGLAIAPRIFGKFSNALLVGNFGDGHINAYDRRTGRHLGHLKIPNGDDLVIDGLWALVFDPRAFSGRLFFTAGPNGEQDGLIGMIRASPR